MAFAANWRVCRHSKEDYRDALSQAVPAENHRLDAPDSTLLNTTQKPSFEGGVLPNKVFKVTNTSLASDGDNEEESDVYTRQIKKINFRESHSQTFPQWVRTSIFLKTSKKEAFKFQSPDLLKRDSNATPTRAVAELASFYLNRPLDSKDSNLEKFLIMDCITKKRYIPLELQQSLFHFLLFSEAQYALGWSYALGFGTVRSIKKAAAAFLQAAEQGDAHAQFNLAGIHEFNANYAEAIRWFEEAAKNKFSPALQSLACYHSFGIGVPEKAERAFDLCHRAAKDGVIDAQFFLSTLYEEGIGTTKNIAKSLKWCKRAAKHGHANAQATWGKLLLKSPQSSQNTRRGIALLRSAAAQNNPLAIHTLQLYQTSSH